MKRDLARNRSQTTWMLGAAFGALAMFLMDPQQGRRRRALATDKINSAATKIGDAIDAATHDLGNRAQGLYAEANRMLSRTDMSSDDRLLAKHVRQRLGRAAPHARAIDVDAYQGRVVLSGPVLAHERQAVLDAVRSVPGVDQIEDLLQEHASAEGVSALQGSGRSRYANSQDSWSPSLRALATMGGGALGIYGLARRTPVSAALALAGLALAARGMTGERGAIRLSKSIHIDAPPDKVFDLWSHCENFPRFMSNVREVRDLGNGRSHWVVGGPAGMQAEWDAVITESRRPEVVAWKSEPGSTIEHEGRVRFQPEDGGTRVDVQMSYSPPAGALGHAVASALQGDPKRQMDEDLMRMKAFVETGNAPHDAAGSAPQSTTVH